MKGDGKMLYYREKMIFRVRAKGVIKLHLYLLFFQIYFSIESIDLREADEAFRRESYAVAHSVSVCSI